MGYQILGSDEDLPSLLTQIPLALITVGQIKSPETRKRLFSIIKKNGGQLPVVKSPDAYCSRHATLGEGTILMHGSLINANACIGENCIINSHALIEHDARVAAHCHVSTGARINGGVSISEGCFIGSGAVIREGVEIGSGAIIGAGQIVMRDVPSGQIVRHRYD
ncbi:sugar O-acyltransferase, sialic acid O-acetyltransferase NeuD family [Ectothiorhodospira magna]|uniref:Sugar O-acyltransferase, sialic acid O-acetyltransferase NeuD family n=1 Tax=Ectothiorhodospira magna TaxID=867345 RepID=A0A1H9A1T9_9GAMM|nr:sugar O-acyltransferase, sialic acid O-acetyltransferase NeuD family [Ectothiorhodospira magna]